MGRWKVKTLDAFENRLATWNERERAKFDEVVKLFTTEWPQGLNKAGLKVHPKQGLIGYTLVTHATLTKERKYYRWQRSEDGKHFPKEPEVYSY